MPTIFDSKQERKMLNSIKGRLASYGEPRVYPKYKETKQMDAVITKLAILSKGKKPPKKYGRDN